MDTDGEEDMRGWTRCTFCHLHCATDPSRRSPIGANLRNPAVEDDDGACPSTVRHAPLAHFLLYRSAGDARDRLEASS